MTIDLSLLVFLGALAGGFVNGLAGFGTGITALGIWLFVLSPSVAASLVIVCSIAGQIQTLPRIWRTIEPRRVIPFILPGLLGVPIGTMLLGSIKLQTFQISIGCLILAYAVHALLFSKRSGIAWGGRVGDTIVGLGGGLLGGLAGVSGPILTVWADMRGWTKDHKRSVIQIFNLTILSAALVSHFFAGFLTGELGLAAAIALPGTFIGSWIGYSLYARLTDIHFKQIILFLLCCSGIALIVTNI